MLRVRTVSWNTRLAGFLKKAVAHLAAPLAD
jgi:hypothetical protein